MATLNLSWQPDRPPEWEAPTSDTRSWRDTRLVELVEDDAISTRLRNAIKHAHSARALPFITVGDYVDAGAGAQSAMLRQVRHFGRKAARELEALVAAVARADDAHALGEAPLRRLPDERAQLMAIFGADTLFGLAADELLSVRLANVLMQPPFADMRFTEAIASFSDTIASLLRQPNCGRKSVEEFRQVCDRHIRRRLHEAGVGEVERLAALLLGHSPPTNPDGEEIGQPVPAAPAGDAYGVPEHERLFDRLEWLIAELDPRAQQILRRRNGISQDRPETLEEIGADFEVTRERIRQIEAKSIKRMRARVRRAPIASLLLAEGPSQWRALAGDRPLLRHAELHERRRAIDPYVRLALDVIQSRVEEWLDEIAQPMPFGWLSPDEDATAIEAAGSRLAAAIEERPLPQAFASLVGQEQACAGSIAAELILGRPQRHGYMMPPRVGARLTRLVRLHALLAADGGMLPLEQLLVWYRAVFADDPCSERDAEIVMDAAPHLCLEIEDGCWAAIGSGGMRIPHTLGEARPVGSRIEDAGTIAHALQKTLESRGPTRLGELLDDAARILPDGRSINSIGPVLLTRRELFVRALPGVYALPDQVPAYAKAMPENWPVLFNDIQARFYALARYAGEPRRIFPLWSAAAEYALCLWARHSGGPGTFPSLLAVATIDEWPIGEAERQEWRRLQAQDGRFELGSSLRHGSAYERPTLDRAFAACRYAAAHGAFNWVAANRLTGRKIDSHGGAGLMALLIRLGALEETEKEGFRWQRPHRATEAAALLASELEGAFARNSLPDWDSTIGVQLVTRALGSTERADSWVDESAVAAMLSGTVSQRDWEMSDDPLEQLLAHQRQSREAERRQATLAWLLED